MMDFTIAASDVSDLSLSIYTVQKEEYFCSTKDILASSAEVFELTLG